MLHGVDILLILMTGATLICLYGGVAFLAKGIRRRGWRLVALGIVLLAVTTGLAVLSFMRFAITDVFNGGGINSGL
jgi:hypothetical protein